MPANDEGGGKTTRNPVTGKMIGGWWTRPNFTNCASCHRALRGMDVRCCDVCGKMVGKDCCWADRRCKTCQRVGAHTAGRQCMDAHARAAS